MSKSPKTKKAGPQKGTALLEAAGLLLFCAALVALNLYWIRENGAFPRADDNSHILHSLSFHHLLAAPTWGERLRSVLTWQSYYPPLQFAVTSIFYTFAGVSIRTAEMSLTPFLVVYLASLYWMGRCLGGPRVAWMTVLLAGTSPAILYFSRLYYLDFPLASLTALAAAALVCSGGFEKKPGSLVFGVALGCALLTKYTVLFFLGPLLAVLWLYQLARGAPGWWAWPVGLGVPVLLLLGGRALNPFLASHEALGSNFPLFAGNYLIVALAGVAALELLRRPSIAGKNPHTPRLLNMALALWTGTSLAGLWYLANVPHLIEKADSQWAFNQSFTFMGTLQYSVPHVFQLFSFSPVLAAAGLVMLLVSDRRRECLWALVALAGGVAITCLLTPPDLRYLLPAVPFLAIFALSWMPRRGAISAVVLFCLVPLALFQGAGWLLFYRAPRLAARLPVRYVYSQHDLRPSLTTMSFAPVQQPPEAGNPPVEKIIDAFREELRARKITTMTTVGFMNYQDRAPLQGRTLELCARLEGLPLQFLNLENGRSAQELRYFVEMAASEGDAGKWEEEVERAYAAKLERVGEFSYAGYAIRIFRLAPRR